MLAQPTDSPTGSPFVLDEVDFAALSDGGHVEYLTFQNRLRAELAPRRSAATLEAHLARGAMSPRLSSFNNWKCATFSEGLPFGLGSCRSHTTKRINISPHSRSGTPDRRREGIARRLLRRSRRREERGDDFAHGRYQIGTEGKSFLRAIGAEPGTTFHTKSTRPVGSRPTPPNFARLREASRKAVRR
jgi:hypothetical protein